jgi:hypothetical protein
MLTASPSSLVSYASNTASGDPTRPNFILNQLNNASLTFSAATGIGSASAAAVGSVMSITGPGTITAANLTAQNNQPLHGRHAAGDFGGIALGLESADGEQALRHRINVAVSAKERRHQQGAAKQALGVAHGRGGDVDAGTLRGERRHVGNDHHGRHVAGANLLAADVDAQAFQHALQGLLGERRVVERVAGAVKADDDEPIADQLVLPNAFDIRQILDPRNGAGI